MEIGDSKGSLPPTPTSYSEAIPSEAKAFATSMMKQFLLTLSDKEAECKSILFSYGYYLIDMA
jgi:hypothetical protein